MNVSEIDESLLTAYALGELDGPARARVAAHLDVDPAARMLVAEVRETAGIVAAALERELVDSLAEIEMGVIEQRLREEERDLARRRFQPAGTSAAPAARPRRREQTRWLPFAASLAASVLVVAGTLAVLLPRLGRPPVATGTDPAAAPGAGGVAVVGPHDTVEQPTLPGGGPVRLPPDDTSLANEEYATNAAPGEGGEQWEAVEGMVDPAEFRAALDAQQREAELAARDAVTPAPGDASPAAPAAAAAPKKPAPAPGSAVARGPAPSPEAERVRRPNANASPKARGPRTVNVSPPRDPRAFEQIAKDAGKLERPRLYENPFRDARQRPRSSFPVRVETASYGKVREMLLDGHLPPPDVVRIEELLNRFAYADPAPSAGDPPLAATAEVSACMWNTGHRLARVALRARDGGATVVARGVEVSVEFNPEAVRSWRLIGYENARQSADRNAAGFPADLTAGSAATALYEIVPAEGATASARKPVDLFTLAVHYTDPQEPGHNLLRRTATDTGSGFDFASDDFRFATAVAAFGLILRDSQFKGTADFAAVMRWAEQRKGDDPTGERAAFIDLARTARDLTR